jgi:LPS sulfotransferase NodH
MADVSIGRLSLYLSGLSEAEGNRLVRLIAEGLAAAPAATAATSHDALRSSVNLSPATSMQELADQVVADLLRQMKASF